jgi:hypothetical protein
MAFPRPDAARTRRGDRALPMAAAPTTQGMFWETAAGRSGLLASLKLLRRARQRVGVVVGELIDAARRLAGEAQHRVRDDAKGGCPAPISAYSLARSAASGAGRPCWLRRCANSASLSGDA